MQKNFFQKRHFSSQSLDFLPPKKPGLYISRKDFFFEKNTSTGNGTQVSCMVAQWFTYYATGAKNTRQMVKLS